LVKAPLWVFATASVSGTTETGPFKANIVPVIIITAVELSETNRISQDIGNLISEFSFQATDGFLTGVNFCVVLIFRVSRRSTHNITVRVLVVFITSAFIATVSGPVLEEISSAVHLNASVRFMKI